MSVTDRRAGLLFAIFTLVLIGVVARAAWVQGVEGSDLRASAQNQQFRTVQIPAGRGTIYDRKGKELAISEDTFTIEASPMFIEDPDKAARKIAKALGDSPARLRKIFTSETGFAYVARRVDVSRAERVRGLEIAGISTVPDTRRAYPQGSLAAPVIGVVGGDDYRGLSGLESYADETLVGADGEVQTLFDNRGRPLERNTLVEAIPGEDLTLSIDAGIQAHVEGVVARLAEDFDAAGVSVVVMDPRSSEILSMASYPGFDPNNLENARSEDMRDHAVGITYEPGSTFKAITVAGALEDGLVDPGTSFHLPSTIQVADREIGEAHARPPITASVAEILAMSSNVGAVKIGQQLGGERFDEWVHRFGFGKVTGVDYPGEEIGIVPSYEEYSGASMGNLPIGQGISVTPMQMAAAYAAIANGGILREPQLIIEQGGRPVEAPEGTRIIKKKTAAQLRQMLEGVLGVGGTASEVEVPGYTLAGKTGTAEKVVNGVYSETDYIASFIGFAPASKPRLLVSVIVDEPRGENAGSVVAAPAFGQIAAFALPYLGIPGDA